MRVNPNKLIDEPRRLTDLNASELPTCTKSSTAMLEPTRDNPETATADPSRDTDRIDNALPI
jgi:hypothetical protein